MLEHTSNAKLNTWEPESLRIVPVVPSFYLAVTHRNTKAQHSWVHFHQLPRQGEHRSNSSRPWGKHVQSCFMDIDID